MIRYYNQICRDLNNNIEPSNLNNKEHILYLYKYWDLIKPIKIYYNLVKNDNIIPKQFLGLFYKYIYIPHYTTVLICFSV